MRMLDLALMRMSGEADAMELERVTQVLMRIRPDYTLEDILKDPRQPI